MPLKKKKFTTKQIKDFAAREERVEHFKTELPELLDEVLVRHEDCADATSNYISKYSKAVEDHQYKFYSNEERNKMLQENLQLFAKLKNEMEGLKSVYSLITDVRKTREEIALNLDVNKPQLMDLLYHGGKHLPLWMGELGESPPPRTGRLAEEGMPEPGELVAAYVKDMWILAEVKAVDEEGRVTVRDVDDDAEGFVRLPKEQLILLPIYRVDPKRHPYAVFEQSSVVLALYPQTTCFYKGVVESPPYTPDDSYLITFEDEEYENGHPPAVNVSQRFVLNFQEKPVEIKSICVELSDSSETDEETPEPAPQPMPVRRKFKMRDSDEISDRALSGSQRDNSEGSTDAEDEEIEELEVEDGSGYEGAGSVQDDGEDEKEEQLEESDMDEDIEDHTPSPLLENVEEARTDSRQASTDDGSEELGDIHWRHVVSPQVSNEPESRDASGERTPEGDEPAVTP